MDKLGFDYRVTKHGSVLLYHHGKLVTTLAGRVAHEFTTQAASLSTAELQQRMARLTGNYKRGNERVAKRHPRNA